MKTLWEWKGFWLLNLNFHEHDMMKMVQFFPIFQRPFTRRHSRFNSSWVMDLSGLYMKFTKHLNFTNSPDISNLYLSGPQGHSYIKRNCASYSKKGHFSTNWKNGPNLDQERIQTDSRFPWFYWTFRNLNKSYWYNYSTKIKQEWQHS